MYLPTTAACVKHLQLSERPKHILVVVRILVPAHRWSDQFLHAVDDSTLLAHLISTGSGSASTPGLSRSYQTLPINRLLWHISCCMCTSIFASGLVFQSSSSLLICTQQLTDSAGRHLTCWIDGCHARRISCSDGGLTFSAVQPVNRADLHQ